MVYHVTEKYRAVVARARLDHYVAGRVARCVLEKETVFKRVAIVHQHRLAAFHHRQHAVVKGAYVRGFLALRVHALPVFELAPCHQVTRVGKRWHPASVVEPRVPADMVDVQVGAHHVGDVVGAEPGLGHPLQEVGVQASERLDQWTRVTYRGEESQPTTGPSQGSLVAPSYTFVDTGLGYQLTPNARINAGIYNLFDEAVTYEEYGYVEDGRRLWLGLNVSF